MTKKDADLIILNEMMSELKKQGPLYRPGNYWEFFEGGILNQIKSNHLENFRKWPGGTPSNIQSFGGGITIENFFLFFLGLNKLFFSQYE